MALKTDFSELNDQELLIRIRYNTDYLGIIYKKCRTNCLSFMRNMTGGKISEYELDDIYQDANIILFEKIKNDDFVLTASFQTYLNSVCRFQLLNYLSKNKLTIEFQEIFVDDDDENPMNYHSSITDSLDEIDSSNEPLFSAIERAFDQIKSSGGKCYELLTQFWYKKRSMAELTEIFEYTNPANTKNQKAKCQERLKVLAFNQLSVK